MHTSSGDNTVRKTIIHTYKYLKRGMQHDTGNQFQNISTVSTWSDGTIAFRFSSNLKVSAVRGQTTYGIIEVAKSMPSLIHPGRTKSRTVCAV